MDKTSQIFTSPISELNQTQRNRIMFIDFYLHFLGKINRKDLIQSFEISPAVATRDFAFYLTHFPNNLNLDVKSKYYFATENFVPKFSYLFEDAIRILSNNPRSNIHKTSKSLITCDFPPALINPNVSTLAKISKSIFLRKPVKVSYYSTTSGFSEKVIVPLALVNDSFRWHVRAFDRAKQRFADFVLTRIHDSKILFNQYVEESELITNDIDWNRMVNIELVPHPNHHKHHKIIEMDFGMINGKLNLNVRASNIGYVLQQWRVDCSSDHKVKDPAFRLWLSDNLVLYGINNAEQLAPYFDKKRKQA